MNHLGEERCEVCDAPLGVALCATFVDDVWHVFCSVPCRVVWKERNGR